MPVFESEVRGLTHEMAYTLGVTNESTLRTFGRNRPKKVPTQPRPTSVRRSQPNGELIQVTQQELIECAEQFDKEHRERTKAAYSSLVQMSTTKGAGFDDPHKVLEYHRTLDELKRHRFEWSVGDMRDELEEEEEARQLEERRRDAWHFTNKAQLAQKKAPPLARKATMRRQGSVKQAKAFDPMQSMWKARHFWSDSHSFLDSEKVYEKAFCLDWSRALRAHKLAAFILKHDDGDDSDEEEEKGRYHHADDDAAYAAAAAVLGEEQAKGEIVDVGEVLWEHHALIYRIFDAFAANDNNDAHADMSGISFNSFKYFIQGCDLDERGDPYCDSQHFDLLFIKINSKAVAGGSSTKDVVLTHQLVGKYGMAVKEAAHHKDTRSLCKHEFFNCLVRIAIMKYVSSGEMHDVSDALSRLLTKAIAPKLEPWIRSDHQIFRRDVCYTHEVDAVLYEHRTSLKNIFSHYADTEHRANEKERGLLSLDEWHTMLKETRVFDSYLSLTDATSAWVTSKMRVINEFSINAPFKFNNMMIEDFYEALTRIACMKALPTDAEIEAAGALDAGDFMLKLREDRAEDEWIDDYWKTKNPNQGFAEYMRAPQPAHRCLSHLILLIVRTVESNTGAAGEFEDRQITKKEIKEYSQNTKEGVDGEGLLRRTTGA